MSSLSVLLRMVLSVSSGPFPVNNHDHPRQPQCPPENDPRIDDSRSVILARCFRLDPLTSVPSIFVSVPVRLQANEVKLQSNGKTIDSPSLEAIARDSKSYG